ncbi:conserved hypothetical protein [Mesorhizobium plurifarium]|uniref:Terminase large subunit n=1 Tax=Mesorhizobium plurifarium TaxID=69974 RepID=A0A0K2VUS8_MESPL|nr:conserved hypothetical protein [Mesorhizobium plurifarium]
MGQGANFDLIRRYKEPGPVAAAYIMSQGPIDLIMGPWGSGKTVASIFKIVRHAGVDFPICRDGVVHVRWAAIRDTYREMAKTALASWLEAFPKGGPYTASDKDAFSGGQDRPVKHILEWDVARKWWTRGGWENRPTKVRLEMEFGAIGEQNLDSFFKGYEISGGWLNECDLVHEDAPGRLYGRTGRYPPRAEVMEWEGERLGWSTDPDSGVETINVPRIVCGDYNPPDESNWTYKRHIEEPEKWPGYHFFQQPSGLSPRGENRIGKTRHQYEEEERQFGGADAPEARRNVHGMYAPKAAGTVIFSRFNILRNKAGDDLRIVPELPFYMGMDAGGRPACGLGQFMPSGQFRMQREVTSDPKIVTGPARFAASIMEVLLKDYRGVRCGGAWADPSSWYGADKTAGELAWVETVQMALQIPIQPTFSNDLGSRFEAVDWYLGDIDANTPRLLVDPSCKHTLRGFVSQYQLTKHSTLGKTDGLQVEKNEYSHIMEAWQYLLFGYRGPTSVKKEAAQMGRPSNVVPMRSVTAKSDFNVFNV